MIYNYDSIVLQHKLENFVNEICKIVRFSSVAFVVQLLNEQKGDLIWGDYGVPFYLMESEVL